MDVGVIGVGTSNFHVIGEIFDRVYPEGGTRLINQNVQTTVVPPGGATIVDFKLDVPSTYILVDHALSRAFDKGALGMLKVDGLENKNIFSGKQSDTVYQPADFDSQAVNQVTPDNATAKIVTQSLEQQIQYGRAIYEEHCLACHQADGMGLRGSFPPLANSDYLNSSKEKAIQSLVFGLSGPIKVNGDKYDGMMPQQDLPDQAVANVLTYIYSQWNNSKKVVSPAEVGAVRNAAKSK